MSDRGELVFRFLYYKQQLFDNVVQKDACFLFCSVRACNLYVLSECLENQPGDGTFRSSYDSKTVTFVLDPRLINYVFEGCNFVFGWQPLCSSSSVLE